MLLSFPAHSKRLRMCQCWLHYVDFLSEIESNKHEQYKSKIENVFNDNVVLNSTGPLEEVFIVSTYLRCTTAAEIPCVTFPSFIIFYIFFDLLSVSVIHYGHHTSAVLWKRWRYWMFLRTMWMSRVGAPFNVFRVSANTDRWDLSEWRQ